MCPQYQKAAKALLPEEYHEKLTKFFSRDLFKYVYTYNALFAKYSFFLLICRDFIQGCTIRNKLCSVTEGDSWLPNFLQKTDKDGHFRAVLIDFQLAR